MGKKNTSKKGSDAAVDAPPDPRAPLPQVAASYQQVLGDLAAVVPDLDVPAEPQQLDLLEAMLHIYFADGLPCGYGQEARRRINDSFVDRNEFRVTEAYEVEDLLADLQIPNLFDRCLAVRESVAQIYNDQNGVQLGFLREAAISDRNSFFQRIPALQSHVVSFLNNLLTLEELAFSDKSTLRAQQKLGLDAKDQKASEFVGEVRRLMAPFGQLPLSVGKDLPSGKPNLKHVLSPASILIRLLPGPKRR